MPIHQNPIQSPSNPKMSMKKTLEKCLKDLREAIQLSQNELARRSELSVSFISKLEAGEYKTLSIDKSKQLAKGLGLSFRDFLAETGLLEDNSTPNANQALSAALRQRRFSDTEINEIVGHVEFLASKREK